LEDFGLPRAEISKILLRKNSVKKSFIEEKLAERNVVIYCFGDDEYPEELVHIPHSPYLLYVRGVL
jgi:predicted Rossmann fold nucleotide-binding protein DprA/Smf involved in DNA uptake